MVVCGVAIVSTDEDERIVLFNEAAETMFAVRPLRLLGRQLTDWFQPDFEPPITPCINFLIRRRPSPVK